jgi:hypothetical protein
MIHVSEQQLKQVEYLLEQSSRGHHVLFDPAELRRVFEKARTTNFTLSEEEAYETEPHLERLLEIPSLADKRAYLRTLDRAMFDRLVLTYFSIVENSLLESRDPDGALH